MLNGGGAVGSRGVEEENGAGGIEAAPGDGLLAVGVEVREDEDVLAVGRSDNATV